jgi:hypothetical protein
VAELAKEGWYQDPEGRHEYRWFSQGSPTDLVMDNHQTSRDPISVTDPAVYAAMALAEPPDDGPLLHRDDASPPHFEILNFGTGPVAAVNTSANDDDPYRPGD